MEKTKLRDVLELLHYKNLDSEIRVKIGNEIYKINAITENSKNGLLIECNK